MSFRLADWRLSHGNVKFCKSDENGKWNWIVVDRGWFPVLSVISKQAHVSSK